MQFLKKILFLLALVVLASCQKDPELTQPSTGACYKHESATKSLDIESGNVINNGDHSGNGITDDDDDDDDADVAKKKEKISGR